MRPMLIRPALGRLWGSTPILSLLLAGTVLAEMPSLDAPRAEAVEMPVAGPAEALLGGLHSPDLRALAAEVLERSPEVARAEHLASAAEAKAPQLRALPDPVAALSLFVLPPQTRTGPQHLSLSLQQKLPWFGKLALKEQAALHAAVAARAEVEALRLDQLTEVRRLGIELSFLDAYRAIVETERGTLVRYEKAAQARYASGTGLQQEIVRIQAQITRTDTRLLEIKERRSTLRARLNRLLDRPADTPLEAFGPQAIGTLGSGGEALVARAHRHRPELAAAEARIAAAEALIGLAEKGRRPDLNLGFSYTLVGERSDSQARLNPPEDEGDDILALTGSLNLPVRRRKIEAGLEEARATRWAAEEAKRALSAEIESRIGDLSNRLPLLREHLSLLERVLIRQAREALRSAETAYSTGKLGAIDLLDAEVVLFEVRIAAARTRADLALAWAELERAVAHPLPSSEEIAP